MTLIIKWPCAGTLVVRFVSHATPSSAAIETVQPWKTTDRTAMLRLLTTYAQHTLIKIAALSLLRILSTAIRNDWLLHILIIRHPVSMDHNGVAVRVYWVLGWAGLGVTFAVSCFC